MGSYSQPEVAFATDIGNVREINEDSVFAEWRPCGDNGLTVAALLVADGLGGHDGGEVASAMALESFVNLAVGPAFAGEIGSANVLASLTHSIINANSSIFDWGSKSAGFAKPGTTMTAAIAVPGRYEISHVGDSRAYIITPQQAEQITLDDSVVAEAVRQGLLTEHEARVSPYRNQLTRSVGTADEVDPAEYSGHLEEGDVLLLCSDGFSEYITTEELHTHVLSGNSLQAICDQFVATAKQRGGHDNITVAAVRFGDWTQRKDEVDAARTGHKRNKTGTKRLSLFKPFG